MRKGERLLDTQTFVWLVTGNEQFDKELFEDIAYFQHPYCVSILSWIEFSHLLKNKKLRGVNIDLDKAKKKADALQIYTYMFGEPELKTLDSLPLLTIAGAKHGDPFDRGIIASAINWKCTLISTDLKFPAYRKYGLDLIEI